MGEGGEGKIEDWARGKGGNGRTGRVEACEGEERGMDDPTRDKGKGEGRARSVGGETGRTWRARGKGKGRFSEVAGVK